MLRALRDAVSTHAAIHRSCLAAVTESTRGGFISDLFYFNVQNELGDDGGFAYDEVKGQRYITFDDRILQRIKHLDRELVSSNYPTRQAKAFVQQARLEGFPDFDRLHLGYRLDITGMRLEDVFIALPVGRRSRFNAWVWQVWGDSIADSTVYGQQSPMILPGQKVYRLPAYDDYRQRLG